jgi:hypothetical protein
LTGSALADNHGPGSAAIGSKAFIIRQSDSLNRRVQAYPGKEALK